MSNRPFLKGLQGLGGGDIDFDTDTVSAAPIDLNDADTAVKVVTGATNATPIVVTAVAHGYSNGDIVVIGGITGNLAANGTWLISAVATDTFTIKTLDNQNTTGSGAYGAGGYAVNVAAPTFYGDINAGLVGTPVNLAGKTITDGVANCTTPITFVAVAGDVIEAVVFFKDTANPATSRLILFNDGRIRVEVAADAAISATTIWVLPLEGAIASGASLVFSNGATAVLSAPAAVGARFLTVTALAAAITAGHQVDAPYVSNGLPYTPNGSDLNFNVDAGAGHLFRL